MYSEGRVTRSRARSATDGQTPLFQLPEGKTPGRTTRKTVAAKQAEAPTPRAALFDVTNSTDEVPIASAAELPPLDETKPVEFQEDQQAPAAEEAAPVEEVAPEASAPEEVPVAVQEEEIDMQELAQEDSVASAAPEVAEEPPSTPPPAAMPASPAHLAQAPTPTGLGLSTLAPMSPMSPAIMLSANTPVVTPLQGVPTSARHAQVYDTLSAAAQVFAQEEEEGATSGFGSPVKFSESPAMSVSIGGAISLQDGMEDGDDVDVTSTSPAGASMGMPTPVVELHATGSPATKSPAPLGPQSPLDFGVEDYEAMEDMPLAHASLAGAATEAAPRPKLRSKVVLASPNSYDPRSLRQLKAAIKAKVAEKEAASAANSEDEEYEEEEGGEYYEAEEGGELLEAMGALNLGGSPAVGLGPYDLRGMPKPEGQHIRFDDESGEQFVSPKLKTMLRGMPTPHGKHVFFEEDDQ